MMGNWAQHAFVDQDEPDNDYKNSITCINSSYNRQCHIGHHANPNMHWTDMPTDFLKNKQKDINNQAIVFEGLDYNQIWFFLVTKQYASFVDIGNQFETQEDVVALLKSRTLCFKF